MYLLFAYLIAIFSLPAVSLAADLRAVPLPGKVVAVRAGPGGPLVRTQDGQAWRLQTVNGDVTATKSIAGPRPQHRPGMLPDGVVVPGTAFVRRVWLTEPTDRYGHGVLGDTIEAGGLSVEMTNGQVLSLSLPDSHVFEDRYPRLADLNGDGRDEFYLVRSSDAEGAGLVVADVVHGQLKLVAFAAPIGIGHRWLNPVGAGDFDGDGRVEVAVVIMPHLGGTLVTYERRGDRLVEEAFATGFSNHAMGSRNLGLSAVLDTDGDGRPELVVPDNAQRVLRVMGFEADELREKSRVRLPSRLESDIAVWGNRLVFATRDGRLHSLTF